MRRCPMFQLPLLVVLLAAPGWGATAGYTLSPRTLRQMVARQVVRRPAIVSLIPRAPVLGGAWLVRSARDVWFVAPGVVALDYEDGHMAGRLIVRVIDVTDPRSWEVLADRTR
jgi:hypothetical protein